MKLILSRLLICLCIGIAGFAIGRMTSTHDTYVEVPPGNGRSIFAVSYTDSSKVLYPFKDTTDLAAVQGMDGPFVHHIYKLDSVRFDQYYFRTGWTCYIQTGGYRKDTCVFVKYQGRPACVSKAVDYYLRDKYLGR